MNNLLIEGAYCNKDYIEPVKAFCMPMLQYKGVF